MVTVIIFILLLSVLVIAHELGHFITARVSGMKVYEFGVGFPPRAFGIYRDSKSKKWIFVKGKGNSSLKQTVGGENTQEEYPTTLYSINWLPLGGFVKIKGENGENPDDKDSFGYHKAWKRFIVVVAGVTMNVLFAGLILGGGFIIGLPTDVSGVADDKAIMEKPVVMIQQVSKESPADLAGIKFGDQILSADGKEMVKAENFVEYVRAQGEKEMIVAVQREKQNLTFIVKPAQLEDTTDGVARLGITSADVSIVRYPWHIALYKGFAAAFIGFANIFILFIVLIKNLIFGNGLTYDVSGPVGIASMVGQSARMGINYLISTAAMLSITLAVINILPIPALDGGRALFILIEGVFRKPVSAKIEQAAHTMGFALLMLLILIVTVKDVFKLFG